jgi:nucleoside-diphosphate-sugar epimerase
MQRVLVTGATGFIGSHLCPALTEARHEVMGAVRELRSSRVSSPHYVAVGDVGPDTDWTEALKHVSAVVHLAGHAHRMDESREDSARICEHVNVQGTLKLAKQAAQAGVKRLVFLSTVKVNGETSGSQPFCEQDDPLPSGPYAVSKRRAEEGLLELSRASSLEIVIIRPPLVYGPGVRANFLALLRAVDKGIPLPLARVNNRRSLVGVRNLTDMLERCISHPLAAGQVFFVSDESDISTPDLIRAMAAAIHRPVRLIPAPLWPLKLGARLVGKRESFMRLCQSLTVSTTKAREVLKWAPHDSLSNGLSATAQWYIENCR